MRLSYRPFHKCTIKGCYNLSRTHDYCKLHQYKLKKYGDPLHVRVKKGKV